MLASSDDQQVPRRRDRVLVVHARMVLEILPAIPVPVADVPVNLLIHVTRLVVPSERDQLVGTGRRRLEEALLLGDQVL